MEKKDCFAYKQERCCSILTEMYCAKCKFYKTKEQFDAEAKRAEMIWNDHQYCDLCKNKKLGECNNCDLIHKKVR